MLGESPRLFEIVFLLFAFFVTFWNFAREALRRLESPRLFQTLLYFLSVELYETSEKLSGG